MDQLNLKRFAVASWVVEPDLNQISDGAKVVKLEPRTMDVLVYLATHAGTVISREELFSVVWGDDFVTENTLSRTISRLRKALGDDWQQPRFLETIIKSGYRWIVPVRALHPNESSADNQSNLTAKPGKANSRPMRVGSAVTILFLIAVLFYLWLPKTDLDPERLTQVRPAVTLTGRQANSVISPDGQHIAFAWQGTDGQNWDIYVQSVGADNPRRLTNDPVNEVLPAWSPDGLFLAFVAGADECGIFRVPLTGGPRVKMAQCLKNPRNLNWSPDGLRLAFDGQSESGLQTLYWVSADGGSPTPIVDPVPGSQGDWQPVFSPDGSKLAFLRKSNADLHHLFLHDFGTGATKPVTTHQLGRIRGLDWTADGKSLVYSYNRDGRFSLWCIDLDGERMRQLPIIDDWVTYPSLARKANSLIYKNYADVVDLFSLNLGEGGTVSGGPNPVVPSTRSELYPRLSSQNGRLAYVSNRNGAFEVWSGNVEGGELICHSKLAGLVPGMVAWKPDGGSLVYSARRNGQSDLFWVDVNSRSPRALTQTPFNEVNPCFSLGGTTLYFGSDQGGKWQIWEMELTGGGHRQLTQEGGFFAQPDPGGGALWFSKLNHKGIFRLDMASGNVVEAWSGLGLSDWANWQICSSGLYYVQRPNNSLMHQPFAGVPRVVYRAQRTFPYLGPAFHVDREERTVVFGQITQSDDEIMIAAFR